MSDEKEFQQHKRDFLEVAAELGLKLPDDEVETRLRYIQARAQEHEVPMDRIERDILRKALTEPIPREHDQE